MAKDITINQMGADSEIDHLHIDDLINAIKLIAFSAGTFTGNITLADGTNIVVNTTTGTQIGTAVTQKVGFWGATPIVQPASADQASCPAGGTGAAAGGWDTAGHRDAAILLINAMRTALVNAGLMKGAA